MRTDTFYSIKYTTRTHRAQVTHVLQYDVLVGVVGRTKQIM